jgi:transposase
MKPYRDPVTKKARRKNIMSIGYLDELEKQYLDPVAHFRQLAFEMTEQEKAEQTACVISLNRKHLEEPEGRIKNIGYAALSVIYHELGLDVFLRNRARSLKATYSVNAVIKLLVYARILEPGSKKRTFERRGNYFDTFDFSLASLYRCLSLADELSEAIQRHLHRAVAKIHERRTDTVYYDVTNFYFEIDRADGLRKKGVSKEHRPDPIVQLGLFVDSDGIPISYGLFPGNTNDCSTLLPMLNNTKDTYGLGRAVIVADKGLNTASNIAGCISEGYGYVFSQTVRGGSKAFKGYILDEEGYEWKGEGFKVKSRIVSRKLTVKDSQGGESEVEAEEKQVIFYNACRDKKAKEDRAMTVQKARDMENNPAKYNRSSLGSAAKYIKNLSFDKKTGEVLVDGVQIPVFDEAKLAEEEKYDGYYAIVSSEVRHTDEEIIELYRGLWQIEESFRVTKNDFETRPVYLSRHERISAHFLICFMALVIARLLQKRLGNRFSIAAIADSLKRATCFRLEENWYAMDNCDDVILALRDYMGIDLTQNYMQHGEIKGILAGARRKKTSATQDVREQATGVSVVARRKKSDVVLDVREQTANTPINMKKKKAAGPQADNEQIAGIQTGAKGKKTHGTSCKRTSKGHVGSCAKKEIRCDTGCRRTSNKHTDRYEKKETRCATSYE